MYRIRLQSPYGRLQKAGLPVDDRPGTIYAGFPTSRGFGVGRESYSKFLPSTALLFLFYIYIYTYIYRTYIPFHPVVKDH